jgi:hypothetical protein
VSELSLRRGPIRLVLSRSLWRSVWYLLGYLAVGWALFAIAVAVGGAGITSRSPGSRCSSPPPRRSGGARTFGSRQA